MKRFAFSLQRMLAFKTTMYEKERNTLAQMRAERLTVFTRRQNTERQALERDAAFREKAAAEGVRLAEVTAVNYQRESADRLCELLDAELLRMDEAIEAQLQVVIALDKEVQSLEKLREKQWEEYQAEAAREEQERILELVSRKFSDEQAEERTEEEAELAAQKLERMTRGA